MTLRSLIFICFLLFCGLSVAAEQSDATPPAEQGLMQSLPAPVQNLLHYALNFEGISYRRGGSTPAGGFDCSGFVRYVYDRVEGVVLPHSSNALSKIGNVIRLRELLPGDLVFFSFTHTISHVGIYLGNDQFIHASSSQTGNVMVSSLTDSYWAKHFTLARRIEAPAAPVSAAANAEQQPR